MVVLMRLVLKGKLCTFFFDNHCPLLKPKKWARFNMVVILYYNCIRYVIICTFSQHMKFSMFVVLLYFCIQYMYIHNTHENTQMNMTDIECSYLIMLLVKRYMNRKIVIAVISIEIQVYLFWISKRYYIVHNLWVYSLRIMGAYWYTKLIFTWAHRFFGMEFHEDFVRFTW